MNSPLRFGVPVLVLAALVGAWGCATAGRPPEAVPAAAPPGPVAAPGETAPLVALALGGGGARGFAEVGVLRVLEQEKIPVGLVVGTSVGSLIGALYADTGSVLDLEFEAVEVSEEDVFDYRAFSIFSGGFVKGERLERFLNEKLRHRKIEEFPVRFAAVAVELTTGEAAIFDRGPAAKAVHASCAIPGVFVPVEIDGKTYVDGGVTEPIPVEAARRLGAQVVIAVAIPAEVLPEVPRNPVALVYQAVSIMSAEIARLKCREADVVIWPEVGGVRYDDFSQKKRLMEAGAAATRAAMPAIREAIRARTASPAGRP